VTTDDHQLPEEAVRWCAQNGVNTADIFGIGIARRDDTALRSPSLVYLDFKKEGVRYRWINPQASAQQHAALSRVYALPPERHNRIIQALAKVKSRPGSTLYDIASRYDYLHAELAPDVTLHDLAEDGYVEVRGVRPNLNVTLLPKGEETLNEERPVLQPWTPTEAKPRLPIGTPPIATPPAPEVASLPPELPTPLAGPYFTVRDDGKLDLAPPEALDHQGNDLTRLQVLHPILRDLIHRLCDTLGTGNRAHALLLDRAQSYRALISHELQTIPFGQLYIEGVRLQNAYAAANRKIVDKELPPFDMESDEALESALDLHGAFMLSTAVGLELIGAEQRYKRQPEDELRLRDVILKFAAELANRPDLVEERAALLVQKSAEEINGGSNKERNVIVASNTTTNALIVILSAATIGSLPIVGAAVAGAAGVVSGGVAALVGYEALKKSSSFLKIVSMVTKKLDVMTDTKFQEELIKKANLLAPYAKFVTDSKLLFRQLADRNQFSWARKSLDWLAHGWARENKK
jgi:hypothetical protein